MSRKGDWYESDEQEVLNIVPQDHQHISWGVLQVWGSKGLSLWEAPTILETPLPVSRSFAKSDVIFKSNVILAHMPKQVLEQSEKHSKIAC